MDKRSAKQMKQNPQNASTRERNESKVKAHERELTRTIKDLEKTVESLKSLLVEKDEEIRSISRASSASYVTVRGVGSASTLRSMSRASSTSFESVHGFGSTSTLRSEVTDLLLVEQKRAVKLQNLRNEEAKRRQSDDVNINLNKDDITGFQAKFEELAQKVKRKTERVVHYKELLKKEKEGKQHWQRLAYKWKSKIEEWLKKLETSSDTQTNEDLLVIGNLVATNMQEPECEPQFLFLEKSMQTYLEKQIKTQKEIQSRENQNKELLDSLAKMEESIKIVQNDKEKLTQEIASHESKNKELQERLSTFQDSMAGLEKERDTQQEDINSQRKMSKLFKKDIRRLKVENQYLRKTLDGLHKNLIGGEETPLKKLKTPSNMTGDQSILDVEEDVMEVKQKFHEMETDIIQLKVENQYLRKTLDGLHKHLIDGDETLLKELKTPKNMKDAKSIVEVETKIKEVKQKVHEMEPGISKLKDENQYLNKILDGLHKNVIIGDETPLKELKPPKNMKNEKLIVEVEAYMKEVTEKFNGMKTEMDYIYTRISHFFLTTIGDDGKERQTQSNPKPERVTTTGRKPKDSPASTTELSEQCLKMDQDLKLVSLAWVSMKEKDREASYAACLLEELNQHSTNDGRQETQIILTRPPTLLASDRSKSRNQNNKPNEQTQRSRHAEQLQRNFENASNVLKKQIDMEDAITERDCLLLTLERLSNHVRDLFEGRTDSEVPSTFDQIKSSVKKESSANQGLTHAREISNIQAEWKREAEYASQLLEELRNLSTHDGKQECQIPLRKPPIQMTSNSSKDGNKNNNKQNDESSRPRHVEQMQKAFENASFVLKKQMDAQSHVEEKQLLESILDDLFFDIQEFVDSDKSGKTKSALDEKREYIDKDKQRSTYMRLKKAKNIYEIQVELKREAKYTTLLLEELNKFAVTERSGSVRNILPEPRKPPSREEGRNKHPKNETTSKEKKNQVGENPSSKQFMRLNKNFETASSVLYKQIEAQYAARLLDELSKLSQTTKGDEDMNILSYPPTGTAQSRNVADGNVSEDSEVVPQQTPKNERTRGHFAKASAILNQIKETHKLLVEKNRLEDEQKNHQAVVDAYVSDIKNSEKRILGLREDIERQTKQSDERLRQLQRLNVENSELKKDIEHLRIRLSEIAGAKLTHENPSIADLSDPNRPTKLAEKYSELYDNQWTDAFSTLCNYYPDASDEKITGYLYEILIDGYRFCESVRMTQKKSIEVLMLHPDVDMESNVKIPADTVNEIFAKLLNDAAKVISKVTSANMVKAFVQNDEMKKKYGQLMMPCKKFIEECVTLCWLMQVQTPPVCIDHKTVKDQAFRKDLYREYTSKGVYVAFVVWPALFLHEGGPLLVKGVAQGDGQVQKTLKNSKE